MPSMPAKIPNSSLASLHSRTIYRHLASSNCIVKLTVSVTGPPGFCGYRIEGLHCSVPPPIQEHYVIFNYQNVRRTSLLALFHDDGIVELGLDSMAFVSLHLMSKSQVLRIIMIRRKSIRHVHKPWLIMVGMFLWIGMCKEHDKMKFCSFFRTQAMLEGAQC